jgi:hypothetical protein
VGGKSDEGKKSQKEQDHGKKEKKKKGLGCVGHSPYPWVLKYSNV